MTPKMRESRRPIVPSLTSPLLIASTPRIEPITPRGKGIIRIAPTPQMIE